MSIDNWAVCPKCKEAQLQKVAEIYSTAKACYGKVSQEAFLAGLKQAECKVKELEADDCTTFQEEYSIGVQEDGALYITYSGSCTACGSVCKYVYEEENAVKSPVTRIHARKAAEKAKVLP